MSIISKEPPDTGSIQAEASQTLKGAELEDHWASPCTCEQKKLSAHLLSPAFGALSSLPETRLLELLHVELDVLLSDHLAEGGLLWGVHKESSCKKPLVSSPPSPSHCSSPPSPPRGQMSELQHLGVS